MKTLSWSNLRHGTRRRIVKATNFVLASVGYRVERDLPRFILHEYATEDEYVRVQTYHNVRKLDKVWADEQTLAFVVALIREHVDPIAEASPLFGLCHGSRNGFEQAYIAKLLGDDARVLGTDISPTAADFPNSVVWDFHKSHPDWVGACDFIYTNSLDQAWNPRAALDVWLKQLKPHGSIYIEHSELHGPAGASEMDPFGVEPFYFPYVLVEWFGRSITLEVKTTTKAGTERPVWLFIVSPTDQRRLR